MPALPQPRAAQPLTVRVEDDVLTIRIGVALLAYSVQSADGWDPEFSVTDIAAFGRDMARQLELEDEDGTTAVHLMLDRAANDAADNGGQGFDEKPVEIGIDRAQFAMQPVPPAHIVQIAGKPHRQDTKGRWIDETLFKPQDLLQDDLVRQMIGEARGEASGLRVFRDRSLLETASFQALLDQEYGVERGGAKGNVTLTTLDGMQKMEVRVNDLISFGPEIQQAKAIIDECLSEWSTDSRPEIRALVLRAFNVEKEGQVNRSELFLLMKLEIADARWQRAMQAIRDSIQIDGSKTYLRFSERDAPDGRWRTISLDIAQA